MGEPAAEVESRVVDSPLEQNGARAVIDTDGAVWTANEAFCSLVRLDEPALRHLGWRQLVHIADRRYVAAHLVEVLAGDAGLREFEVRLVPPDGETGVPARPRVPLLRGRGGRPGPPAGGTDGRARRGVGLGRDSDGRQGWFLVEAWATT